MKNVYRLINTMLVILSVSMLIGCRKNTADVIFMEIVGTENINQDIQLRPMYGQQNAFDEGRISLLLANTSDNIIYFPVGYGIKMLRYDEKNNKWIEILNQTEYRLEENADESKIDDDIVDNQGRIKLHPFGSPFGKPETRPISAKPLLEGLQKPFMLRFVVTGAVDDDDSSENKVSAYYDIYIDQ